MIYKIRTMVRNAEKLKEKYKNQNEADLPAFKIYDDPRYTTVGKIISHSALDELPQLFNIVKGEMSFVGPRPLPVDEAQKIPREYAIRFSVLPGMTSPWIVNGADHKSFKKWMEWDIGYIKNKSFSYDIKVFSLTVLKALKLL